MEEIELVRKLLHGAIQRRRFNKMQARITESKAYRYFGGSEARETLSVKRKFDPNQEIRESTH